MDFFLFLYLSRTKKLTEGLKKYLLDIISLNYVEVCFMN